MTVYYVHIPGSEAPTAEVDASSTKHARTAYLDYLSRNGTIGWRDRQLTRKFIKVNRMQPGEIQTQIKLEYGVKEPPVEEVEVPAEQLTREEALQQSDRMGLSESAYAGSLKESVKTTPEEDFMRKSPPQPQVQPQQVQQPQPQRDLFANSPIIQLSRRSRGA